MHKHRVFLTTLVILLLAAAQAQFSADPFYEHTDAIRHAYITSRMEARLAVLGALASASDLPEEIVEQAGALTETDLPQLAGSLQASDPQLLEELEATLSEVAELAEADPTQLPAAAQRAAELAAQARRTLVPEDVLDDPAVTAARMAKLLLFEPGVAEAYEEAVAEEIWEYPLGWAALQQVKKLWEELEPTADPELVAEAEQALAALDVLYPTPEPPTLASDPEEAENPSQRLVGLLERITDAHLYPGRNFARQAGLAVELAQRGCEAYQQKQPRLGLERLLAASDSYSYLADTASMLAPEAHARVTELFETIGPDTSAETCSALVSALDEIRVALGG